MVTETKVSEMTEEEYQEQYQSYVDYAIDIYRDAIPYDDPNYEEKLMAAAISYADMEMNDYPAYIEAVCRQHDEMLERCELDDYYGIILDENENELPF